MSVSRPPVRVLSASGSVTESHPAGLDRCRAFCFVLKIAIIGLCLIIVKNYTMAGQVGVFDFGNVVVLIIAHYVARHWPQWWRLAAWVVLASFFVNIADGLMTSDMGAQLAILLLPLLVLYGALLGDLKMSMATLIIVLGIYAGRWHFCQPLSVRDTSELVTLSIGSIVVGMGVAGVWLQHHKAAKALSEQTDDLRRELEVNSRLAAVISHDLGNPLTALIGLLWMARKNGGTTEAQLDIMSDMAERMQQIIESVRTVASGSSEIGRIRDISAGELCSDLQKIFAQRLENKRQRLVPTLGMHLRVQTNADFLCNSVLSNLLSNAIKFTPSGAVIEMHAMIEEDQVILAILDRGPGFPAEVIEDAIHGKGCPTQRGTDGERGTGSGLRIAALYAKQLQGTLLIRQRIGGGSMVAVSLPAPPDQPRKESPRRILSESGLLEPAPASKKHRDSSFFLSHLAAATQPPTPSVYTDRTRSESPKTNPFDPDEPFRESAG